MKKNLQQGTQHFNSQKLDINFETTEEFDLHQYNGYDSGVDNVNADTNQANTGE